jgi:DNA polymerase III delta prime subunit
MDTKRHLIRFVATTNHKNRMMGAMLSRFRVLDIDPPSKTDWVRRVLSMLQAEGLNPTQQDVRQMLQSFNGSARDLITQPKTSYKLRSMRFWHNSLKNISFRRGVFSVGSPIPQTLYSKLA